MLSLGNYLVHSVYHNVKLLFTIGTRGNPIVSTGQGFPPPFGQEVPISCGCCTCACNGPAGNWQFHTCVHERRQNSGDFYGRVQRWNRNARHHPPYCCCCRSRRCPVCNRSRSRSPLYPEALHSDRTRARCRHCLHVSRSCIACLHCEFLNDAESDSNRHGTPSIKNSASKLLSCHEEDDVGSGDFLNRNGGNDSDVELNRFHRTSSCHTSATKFVTCREEVDSCSKDGTDVDVSDNESEILYYSKDKPVSERDFNKEKSIEIVQVESDSGKGNNKQELEVLNVFINKRLRRKWERSKVDPLDNEGLSDSQSSSVFHGFNENSEDEGDRVGTGDVNCTDGTDISNKSRGGGQKSTKYVRTFTKVAHTSVTECFVKEYNGSPSEREANALSFDSAKTSTQNIVENLSGSSRVCPFSVRGRRIREILDVSSGESSQSYEVNSNKCHSRCINVCNSDTRSTNVDENIRKISHLEVEFLKKPSNNSFSVSPEETSEGTISLESDSLSLSLNRKKSDGKVLRRSKKSLKRKLNTNSESPLKRNEKEYLDRPKSDIGNLIPHENSKRTRVGNSKAYLEKKVTELVSIKLGKDLLPEDRGKDTIECNSRRKGKVHSKRTQTAVLNAINRKVSGICHEDRSNVNGKSSEGHFEKRSKDISWGKTRYNLKRHPKDTVSKSSEYSSNTSSGISFKRNSDINLDDSEHVSPKKKRKNSSVSEHENIRRKASKKKCQKTSHEISSRRSVVPRVGIRGESQSCCLSLSGNLSERSQNKRLHKTSNSEVSNEWNCISAQSREKKGTQSATKKHRCYSSVTRPPKWPNDESNTSTSNYFSTDIHVNKEPNSVVEVWHCSSNQTSASSNVISFESIQSCEEYDSLDSDTGSSKHYKGCGLSISSDRRKSVWPPKFARKVVHSEEVVELTKSGHSRHWKFLESELVGTGKTSRKSMGKSGIGAKCRKCMFLSLRGLKKVTVNPFINFYLVYLRNMQHVCPKCAPVKKVAAEAGKIWRNMNEKERKPFMKMALVARSHLDGSGPFHSQLKPLKTKPLEKRTLNAHRHSASKPVHKNDQKTRQTQRSVGTDNPVGRMRWRKRAATHPRGRMDPSPLKLFMIKRRKEDKESNTERPLFPRTQSDSDKSV